MSQLTSHCFLFLRLLRCFSSAGTLLGFNAKATAVYAVRFPHSEISGSKAAQRLPEAYRSYATSFIAVMCQGIHHTPLNAINRPSQRLCVMTAEIYFYLLALLYGIIKRRSGVRFWKKKPLVAASTIQATEEGYFYSTVISFSTYEYSHRKQGVKRTTGKLTMR